MVLPNLATSFLLAAGPKVLETRDKTEAETGSSSAEAGGISGPGVPVGTPAKGSVVGAVVGVELCAPEVVVGVGFAAPELVVGVDADLATPAREARDARFPNLEMRSVRAESIAAAADEEEEESGGKGGSTEEEEGGGGEGEVEVERPGIEVKIADQEKFTAGVTCSESHGAQ